MEQWIIAYCHHLIKFVRTEMESYRLYTVVSELLLFLDKLTNWFIRLNRTVLKGDLGEKESLTALNVLFSVLMDLNILLSPFIPFLTEHMYQNLRNGLDEKSYLYKDSIHYLRIPEFDSSLLDEKVEEIMKNFISVIDLGRKLRENNKINLKMPVDSIQIVNNSKTFIQNLKLVEGYIVEELNVNHVEYIEDEDSYINLTAKANFEKLFEKSKELKEIMNEKKENNEKN